MFDSKYNSLALQGLLEHMQNSATKNAVIRLGLQESLRVNRDYIASMGANAAN